MLILSRQHAKAIHSRLTLSQLPPRLERGSILTSSRDLHLEAQALAQVALLRIGYPDGRTKPSRLMLPSNCRDIQLQSMHQQHMEEDGAAASPCKMQAASRCRGAKATQPIRGEDSRELGIKDSMHSFTASLWRGTALCHHTCIDAGHLRRI